MKDKAIETELKRGKSLFESIGYRKKFNENHDERGRFASGSGGGGNHQLEDRVIHRPVPNQGGIQSIGRVISVKPDSVTVQFPDGGRASGPHSDFVKPPPAPTFAVDAGDGTQFAQDFQGSLEKLGLHVYEHPASEGSDTFAHVVSEKPRTAAELTKLDETGDMDGKYAIVVHGVFETPEPSQLTADLKPLGIRVTEPATVRGTDMAGYRFQKQ